MNPNLLFFEYIPFIESINLEQKPKVPFALQKYKKKI